MPLIQPGIMTIVILPLAEASDSGVHIYVYPHGSLELDIGNTIQERSRRMHGHRAALLWD
jgi:hypothetical protein